MQWPPGTLSEGNDVPWVIEQFVQNFAPAPDALPRATLSDEERAYPRATALLWAQGFLWTANESGLLTRWDVKSQNYEQYRLPGEPVIRALASDGQAIYAGTEGGDIWRITDDDGAPTRIVDGGFGWISALTFDAKQNLWYADANQLDRPDWRYHAGQGVFVQDSYATGGRERVFTPAEGDDNPLRDVTALAFDSERSILWVGTRFAGLLGYDTQKGTWQKYHTFNSALGDNRIQDLKRAPDGSLWLATASGVSSYRNGTWENHPLVEEADGRGGQSLAIAEDGTVWVAGESYIARQGPGERWQVYSVADNPLLSDRSRLVALDDQNHPWFIGRRGKIRFDGRAWTAFDADVRRFAPFTPVEPLRKIVPPPLDFPTPAGDYMGWLQTWPRPETDNGWGIHFLQTHQFDAIEAQRQVNRMQHLGMRWTLVHYADHDQLVGTAPIFQEAGIIVVWRPFIRPYETYEGWAEDVEFLRARGLAPYIQLYNEPSLAQEWDDAHPIDRETYLRNFLSAAQQVYQAGGYVGLQSVDPEWLRLTLQAIKDQGLEEMFRRLFFVPHLYGLNHPPQYDEDINSVLGFREFAKVFEEEIGFVPVMIAGEGGWRPGEAQDNRYPAVSQSLHRDYHLAVFDWFRTGQLSNGRTLPDYLFAFCPWLISDPHDPAAWFDSDVGNRNLTIEAVEAIPKFERKFSWDR